MPEVGERWAYREHPRALGATFIPAEVLQRGPRRARKVRVRWCDGEYEGLDEWVPIARLVVPWADAAERMEDERRMVELETMQPTPLDKVTADALLQIGFAIRAPVYIYTSSEYAARADIEQIAQVADVLPIESKVLVDSPGAFVDAEGTLHVGQEATVTLVRRYCQADPDAILGRGFRELERWREAVVTGWYDAGLDRPPCRVDVSRMRDRLSHEEQVWALVRAWCGEDAAQRFDEREDLRKELERLQTLVRTTARWIKEAGHPSRADALLRSLERSKPSISRPRKG